MENSFVNQIEFTFDSSPSESFMVASPSPTLELRQYELEMLENNNISGMLPLSVGRRNDSILFYYKITSKQALPDLLKRRKITKNEFLGILKDTVGTIIRSENYLLSGAGFVLDENSIYIDPVSLKIYLTYLPYLITSDVNTSLKDLIIKLIVYNANIENKERDNFLQVILEFVRRDTFSLKDFLAILEQLSGGAGFEEKQKVRPADREEMNRPQEVKQVKFNQDAIPFKKEEKKLSSAKPNNNTNIIENSSQNVSISSNKGLLGLLGIIQIAMIVATFMAANYLKGVTGDVTTAYAGSAGIFFCLDFLLIRKILEKNPDIFKKKHKTEENKPKQIQKETMNKKEKTKESKKVKNIVATKDQVPVLKNIENNDSLNIETKVINRTYIDETSILVSENSSKNPYLLSQSPNEAPKVEINKISFVLGRMEGQVDYVSRNNAVGKVHAEILKKQGKCYIKDLNSRNGTYINNERIKSNMEFELNNKDIIQLANSEFTFVMEETK